MILKRQVDKFVDRQEKYHMNMTKAYGLILGQCTVALKNHLESQKDWEDEIEDNAINLLKAIKETCYNHQDNRYPIESIYYSMRAIFTMKQKEDESLSSFTKGFVNAKDVMETQSRKFKLESYMKTMEGYSTMSADNKKKKTDEEYDKFIALAYMKALDQKKCGKMMEDLSNQYALEQKNYPANIAAATNAVINYSNRVNNPDFRKRNGAERGKNDHDKSSFFQKRDRREIVCSNCGKKGHYASQCWSTKKSDKEKEKETTLAQTDKKSNDVVGYSNLQVDDNDITEINLYLKAERIVMKNETNENMKKWILLDSCSTTDIFCDKKLLSNIREVNDSLNLRTNAGVLRSSQKGHLKNYGEVWYHPDAITNIVSLYNVSKKFGVKYNNYKEDAFEVITNNKTIKFIPSMHGLYHYEYTPPSERFAFVESVDENRKYYTKRQFQRAKMAKKLYETVGTSSINDFKAII